MQRHWILGLFASAIAFFAPAAQVASDGFELQRAAAVKQLLTGLEPYVDWCSSKKNWVDRNRALEVILAIDPANMSAKRGLGYQQVADGVWEPPKDPKPPKNYEPAAAKEAPARYAEAVRPWRDRLIQLLEEHKSELTKLQRDSVYAEILAVDPNDAVVRAARGEERNDKGWVLAETVRAKARRTEIKRIVKQALADAPAAADFVTTAEDAVFKIAWKVSVSTDHVRVLSTGERAEALRIAQVVHAARGVFQGVFGTSTDLGPGFTIYLLCDPASKKTFLDNLPNLSATQRSFYEKVEGSGLQGTHSGAWWTTMPERRIDGVTRHVLGAMFQSEFGLTVDVAWAWEGIGLYLTRELIGTRYTWYISPVPENQTGATKRVGPDWMKKLVTPGTNWMNEGYRLVRAADASSMAGTLTRPMNRMSPQDLFLSYVVSAYLLEGQAEKLTGMLRLLGGNPKKPGQKATQVWPSALAMDMEVFVPRLERWLGERR